jgi:hypothetical protein
MVGIIQQINFNRTYKSKDSLKSQKLALKLASRAFETLQKDINFIKERGSR